MPSFWGKNIYDSFSRGISCRHKTGGCSRPSAKGFECVLLAVFLEIEAKLEDESGDKSP
jgi:hypothetical protein